MFELVLKQPAREVFLFTDRPARRAGKRPLGRFVRGWGRLGYRAVPPNAALVIADAPSNRDVLAVELTRPHVGPGGRTLAFRAEVLRGSPGGPLREFARKTDRRVVGRFGSVSLFIDASGQEVGLTFSFTGIPGNITASISFSNAQIDVTSDAATPLFMGAGGPALFRVDPTGFRVIPMGSSVTSQVVIGLDMDVGATSVEGAAMVNGLQDANVTFLSSDGIFELPNGNFSIPLG